MKFLGMLLIGLCLTINPAFSKQIPFLTINHEVEDSLLSDIDEKEFIIKEVVVTEIPVLESVAPTTIAKDLGTIITTVDKLIAFGKKIWKIVEAGKPVTDVKLAERVSVLPKTDNPQTTFYEMENWKAPIKKRYKVDFKNLYGANVVSFVYAAQFEYGGQYNGKGAYLTAVGVEADSVAVSWGFKFNATSSVVSITNRGSKEDPVASVTLKVDYEAESILRTIKSSESFYVTGEGTLSKL